LAEKENLVDDGKKSRAIEIFMGVLKRKSLSPDQIKKSMWKLDEVKIDESMLESLIEVMPDSSEIDRVNSFQGKQENLNVPSKFFWEMRLLPRPKQRGKLWLIKRRFHESISKVTDGIDVLSHAVHTIEKSPSLKNCLFCILTYLNAVSGSTQNSFRLRVLSSVHSKKTRKQNTTFLQYFVRKLVEEEESNLDFLQELVCLNEAERRSCKIIQTQIDEMKAGVRQIQNSLKAYGKPVVEPDCLDNYKFMMNDFVKFGSEKIEELSKRLQELETFTANLATDLGESPRDENGVLDLTFLKTLNKFRKDVKKAVKLNSAEDKKTKRRARIKKQEEEKKRRAEDRKKRREEARAKTRQANPLSLDADSSTLPDASELNSADVHLPVVTIAHPVDAPPSSDGTLPFNFSLPTDFDSLAIPSPQSRRNFSVANLDMTQITGKGKPSSVRSSTSGISPSPRMQPAKRHSISHHVRQSSLLPKTKEGFLNQVDKSLKTGTKKKAERIRKRTRGVSIRDNLMFAQKLNNQKTTPRRSIIGIPGELASLSPFGLNGLAEGVSLKESSATVEHHYASSATVEHHFSPSAKVELHFPTTATVERHYPKRKRQKVVGHFSEFPISPELIENTKKKKIENKVEDTNVSGSRQRGISEIIDNGSKDLGGGDMPD